MIQAGSKPLCILCRPVTHDPRQLEVKLDMDDPNLGPKSPSQVKPNHHHQQRRKPVRAPSAGRDRSAGAALSPATGIKGLIKGRAASGSAASDPVGTLPDYEVGEHVSRKRRFTGVFQTPGRRWRVQFCWKYDLFSLSPVPGHLWCGHAGWHWGWHWESPRVHTPSYKRSYMNAGRTYL